ncbi:MAG: hypothetical protein HYR75_03405, partial [Gemmatimonadetes bacterium]|nr:hypothetical protein [Gemmatimonadota bacterium]
MLCIASAPLAAQGGRKTAADSAKSATDSAKAAADSLAARLERAEEAIRLLQQQVADQSEHAV